jgi:hypothetical protein
VPGSHVETARRGSFDVAKAKSNLEDYERLLVSPRRACHLLDCGTTRLYELLDDGEVESFLDGRSRKIIVESICRYIAKRLSAADKKNPVPRPSAKSVSLGALAVRREPATGDAQPQPGGRMRPRKAGETGDGSVSP